jgi:hypothetical protein
MLDILKIKDLHERGLTTGEIALALGMERNPASRRKIRAVLGGVGNKSQLKHPQGSNNRKGRKKRQTSWDGSTRDTGVNGFWNSDEYVNRSTGHRKYPNRRSEAEYLLSELMEWKIKGKTAEWLKHLDISNISPDDLFKLRDLLSRKRRDPDAFKRKV